MLFLKFSFLVKRKSNGIYTIYLAIPVQFCRGGVNDDIGLNNKFPLPLTDTRDAVRQAHLVVYTQMSMVSVINW